MKIQLDRQIACEQKNIPSATQMKKWIKAVLKKTTAQASAELTVRTVESTESAELNQEYRHKKGATNVLSFPDVPMPGMESDYLGDLVICSELVEQEALEQNIKVEDHWAHLVIHGTLHLLGYDHIKEKEAARMEALETEILKEFGISSPY